MATISFAPAATAAPVVPVEEPVKDIIVKDTPLAINPGGPVGVEGEISADDIKPPRLNLVQRVGNLAEEFTPGAFVYDKSFEIGKEFSGTVLRFKKYYQQKVAFGSEALPQRFDRAEEVRAVNGTTRWSEEAVAGGNYYAETADILLGVEAPENMDEAHKAFFPYANGGKNYGLVVYTITSSAFTSLGKRIITDATMLLRDGLWNGQYRIKSVKQTNATNSWFIPSAVFEKKHDAEAALFFRNIAGL